jgi:Ribose/Galactose Isomerase
MRIIVGADDEGPVADALIDELRPHGHDVTLLEPDQMAGVPGVRAALAWEPWIAEGARKWNDANVLVMSLKRTEPATTREIVDAWLGVEEPDPDETRTSPGSPSSTDSGSGGALPRPQLGTAAGPQFKRLEKPQKPALRRFGPVEEGN